MLSDCLLGTLVSSTIKINPIVVVGMTKVTKKLIPKINPFNEFRLWRVEQIVGELFRGYEH